ncbi:hypothetical protein PG997_003398 [Apiospora hydei]|uniref:Uncharacterized protein n=1 Tax=Apiospora hydei TaxID=1337664 RepID=A0ABR1WZ54_9PEZI
MGQPRSRSYRRKKDYKYSREASNAGRVMVDDLFGGRETEPGCSRIDVRPLTPRFQTNTISYKAAL